MSVWGKEELSGLGLFCCGGSRGRRGAECDITRNILGYLRGASSPSSSSEGKKQAKKGTAEPVELWFEEWGG